MASFLLQYYKKFIGTSSIKTQSEHFDPSKLQDSTYQLILTYKD